MGGECWNSAPLSPQPAPSGRLFSGALYFADLVQSFKIIRDSHLGKAEFEIALALRLQPDEQPRLNDMRRSDPDGGR